MKLEECYLIPHIYTQIFPVKLGKEGPTCQLAVTTTRPGPNTACTTNRAYFDDWEYSTDEILFPDLAPGTPRLNHLRPLTCTAN